jgi:hypothetical protein
MPRSSHGAGTLAASRLARALDLAFDHGQETAAASYLTTPLLPPSGVGDWQWPLITRIVQHELIEVGDILIERNLAGEGKIVDGHNGL